MQVEQGSTSLIFGDLRAQGGRITEENRLRLPVASSTRGSLTRGAFTSTVPAAVVTFRGWYRLQRGAELAPDGQVAAVLEQGCGQQQVDHHPGGDLP